MKLSIYYIPPIVIAFLALCKLIPPLTSRKVVFVLTLMCMSVFQFIRAWFISNDLPVTHSVLGLPFYFSIGLLLYCYTVSLTEYISKYTLRLMFAFLPGIISFTAVLMFILIFPEKFLMLIYYPEWDFILRSVITISWIYSSLWVVLSIRIVYIMGRKKNMARPPFNIFIILALVALPLIITGSITNICSYSGRSAVSLVYYILMIVFAMLTAALTERYPNLMLNRRTPYPFNYRGEVPDDYRQQERIDRDLREHMAEEKPYCDESFSMEGLSRELGITQRQLSRIINDKYGMNFNSFVNRYRVEEAISLLDAPGDFNLLNVSLQVGFNSYSVFYSSFRKHTGLTPRDYIRKKKKDISAEKK